PSRASTTSKLSRRRPSATSSCARRPRTRTSSSETCTCKASSATPTMKRLSSAFFAAIVERPWLTLLAFLVAGGALSWQARRFEIDASAETLLTKNNRFYIETLVANRRFSPQEFLLVAYEPKNH